MPSSPGRRRPRILVVEDEPMVLELIVTRLELGGYQCFSARDGYEGLERLRDVRPAGVVLDINMPRMDGFGVLERMRGDKGVGQVPTMVLTARNQPEDVARAIGLGARDYLAKPFRDQQLLSRVARLIRKAPQPPVRPALKPVALWRDGPQPFEAAPAPSERD
jgi:DNA-binding response OmpR family regulator